MTSPVNGPSPALPTSGGGFRIGIGDLGEPFLVPQGAEVGYTAGVTLASTDLTGGIISYVGSGDNLTLPLATDLDLAVPNAKANDSFDFTVIATTGTATVVTNTGWTILGALTVAASTATKFRARKTAAGAWTLYRVA